MAITRTKDDLEHIIGSTIEQDHFDAVVRSLTDAINDALPAAVGTVDTVTGQAAATVNSVFTAAAVRMLTNPTAASQVSMDGGFGVGWAGRIETAELRPGERDRLRALRHTLTPDDAAPRTSGVLIKGDYSW